MAVGTLDQHQDSTGANFGFGEFAIVRYRGQCFTPSVSGTLGTIGFNRTKGSWDIKVYIDSTSGNLPAHAVGSELYSFTISNANVVDQYGEYDLPVPLSLAAGTQYCFYLASWDIGSNAYHDDYADCHGVASGTREITNNAGSWSNENLTFNYATYMVIPPIELLTNTNINGAVNLRPRIFAPGLAR